MSFTLSLVFHYLFAMGTFFFDVATALLIIDNKKYLINHHYVPILIESYSESNVNQIYYDTHGN